jgi:hypothetical protein
MRRRLAVFFIVFIVFGASLYPFAKTTTGNVSNETPSATTQTQYNPQNLSSSYIPSTQTLSPYKNETMSNQIPIDLGPNQPLYSGTIDFNVTTLTVKKDFIVLPNEPFVAIDGGVLSSGWRISFTIIYPNNTATTPFTSVYTSPFHFFTTKPPSGNWSVICTNIDSAQTSAWLQAYSYTNGTKPVENIEKEQITLSYPGQSLYFKIPLSSDWFYLYVNYISGATIQTYLRQNDTFSTIYRNYYGSTASELFTSKSTPNGTYLLQIMNLGGGPTDLFIEIIKPGGVNLALNVDEGKCVNSFFPKRDLEFLKATLSQSYDWVSFDGSVESAGSGQTAQFLIIDPKFNVILNGFSTYNYNFQEAMIANNSVGTYYIGIFTNSYAAATIKITSSDSVQSIPFATKIDQNITFSQSGQPYYLKVQQNLNKSYFLVAGYSYGPSWAIKYSLITPSLSTLWYSQPVNSYTIFNPTVPTVPYYILKVQGLKSSSSLIHLRFQGLEDYSIQTPECSNYLSRFVGDLIVSNITIRNSNTNVFQHKGAMAGSSYTPLFDPNCVQKTSTSFSATMQSEFNCWRKGYENPLAGNWIQVFIDSGLNTPRAEVEISTLQSGDETQSVKTPYQFNQTVPWNDWWKVEVYNVSVNSPNWFGMITKLFPVNGTYSSHPTLSGYIYDPSFANLQSGSIVNYYTTLGNTIWQNPKQGQWTFVLVGFQQSIKYDPLKALVSFVGDADFHQDWPTNLSGNTFVTNAVINGISTTITVFSNSTISNLSVNPLNERISLVSSGEVGGTGFCIVTIPKTLSERPFTTLIDDNLVNDVLSMENSTHTSIYFTYSEAVHQISVAPTPTLDHFVFSSIGSKTAGTAFSVTITAVDTLGNTFTSYTGTPTLTYSAGSVSPSSTTGGFVNGVWTGSVTVTKAGSGVTLGVNDGSSHSGISNPFSVTHASSVSTVLISPAGSSITAGESKTYSATASDAYGNTWDLTSSMSWSISSGSGGSWSSNVYTSAKAGYWTVTGTYSSTSYSTSLTVIPGNLHHFVFNTVGSQFVGSAFTITVTAKDSYENTVTSYAGSPSLKVSSGSITPSNMNTFVSGVGSTSVVVTPSSLSNTITVTDGVFTGTSNSFAVTYFAPTPTPTSNPTTSPTTNPTSNPTSNPTAYPTAHPTAYPTRNPTNPPIPEFPSVIVLALIGFTCLALTLIFRKKHSATMEQPVLSLK